MQAIAARMSKTSPRFQEWVTRAEERPAYKRALERGGPLEMMA
jgi:hypothetical protein